MGRGCHVPDLSVRFTGKPLISAVSARWRRIGSRPAGHVTAGPLCDRIATHRLIVAKVWKFTHRGRFPKVTRSGGIVPASDRQTAETPDSLP